MTAMSSANPLRTPEDAKSEGSLVTVGLVDGRTRSGRIRGFLPQRQDFVLEPTGAEEPGSATDAVLATEQIAYVAFHLEDGAPPPRRLSVVRRRLRIHVAGGKTLVVEVDPAAPSGPLGFHATPVERNTFRDIFFYAHGVNAKEIDQPLGTMLVQAGIARQPDIDRGLATQRAARPTIGQILIDQKHVDAASVEQAAALQQRKRLRIGEVLIQAGLITPEILEQALAEQKLRGGKRLGEVLVEMKLITEHDLASVLAAKFHLPFVNLDEYPVNVAAADEVSHELLAKYRVLPVDSDLHTLTLAIHDPLATDAVDALRFHLGKRITEVMVTRSQLDRFVDACLARTPTGTREVEGILKELAAEDLDLAEAAIPAEDANASDSAVIKLVNQIIIDAYRRGASDIHIEPNGAERPLRVRFRIDGECVAYQELPSSLRSSLVARLKIMARLDIAERRKPQDGKIRFKIKDQPLELRVATLPTANQNEDVVLRLLAASKPLPLDRMGISERNLRELKAAAVKPYGLILCVGPTGSGKTTTLHSLLGHINTIDRKIWTAEDPIEITQEGLRQLQVQPKIGLTFAVAMRSFLRADPDVIMVGEMRDQETASTGIEASLTGHLVASTLHTNSAPETITRLIEMELDPFSFADALLVVLAQRLARTLCKACRQQYPGTQEEYDELAGAFDPEISVTKIGPFGPAFKLWRAVGCDECGQTGYKGRIGIHELLVATPPIKTLIRRRSSVDEIRKAAIDGGMTTLLQDGIQKVMAGLTDLKQVLAVCNQ